MSAALSYKEAMDEYDRLRPHGWMSFNPGYQAGLSLYTTSLMIEPCIPVWPRIDSGRTN